MGHGATFECPVGFQLEGAAGITCQYNGEKLCTRVGIYQVVRKDPESSFQFSLDAMGSCTSCRQKFFVEKSDNFWKDGIQVSSCVKDGEIWKLKNVQRF